jgi:hypothetical protein
MPESTWFIKDMMYSSTHDGHGEMYTWMFESEEQLTVFSNRNYPQFMQNDVENQRFISVHVEKSNEIGTSFDNFFRMPSFIHLVDLISKLIKYFLP